MFMFRLVIFRLNGKCVAGAIVSSFVQRMFAAITVNIEKSKLITMYLQSIHIGRQQQHYTNTYFSSNFGIARLQSTSILILSIVRRSDSAIPRDQYALIWVVLVGTLIC